MSCLFLLAGLLVICGTIVCGVAALAKGDAADPPLARSCAWCSQYESDADRDLAEAGAETTHTICTTCYEKMKGTIEEVIG